MPLFNQTTIVGVGLMGGSLAKAIKRKKIARKVIGFFRNKQKLNKAIKEKIVDRGYLDLRKAVSGSDLVVLALPINQIIKFMPEIKKHSNSKTIVIDVGSTKNTIVKTAEKLKLNFVGSHPLAGSEKKGMGFSADNLFHKTKVVITPTNKTNKNTLNKIRLLWNKLNAKVIVLSPDGHDEIISYISHLPHIAAFCLINAIPKQFISFGASGLKDTTRIALSDAEIWSDIFLSNKKELLKAVNNFERKIEDIKKAITKNKRKQVVQILNIAKSKRQTIKN